MEEDHAYDDLGNQEYDASFEEQDSQMVNDLSSVSAVPGQGTSQAADKNTCKKDVDEDDEIDAFEETSQIQNSLNLEWIVGMNKDIIGGVHNLSDSLRKEVFYVSGHIGVIYDHERRKQMLLQGHTSEITCVAVSEDKRWIATCDSGAQCMVVVWDSIKGIPVKTIFDPHPNGVQSIHLSHDSLYLASLGCPEGEDGSLQTLSVWEWAADVTEPLYTCTFPVHATPQELNLEELEAQHNGQHIFRQQIVRFHQSSSKYLVTSGPDRVVFWSWRKGTLDRYTPPVGITEFRTQVGKFTQSVYIPGETLAATATDDGKIVLWDIKSGSSSFIEKYALKVIEVHRKSAINYLTCIGKYIVTGSEDGYVRFFDHKLRLDAWFEEFNAGPIISISFEKPSNEPPAAAASVNESVASAESKSQDSSRMESRASRQSNTATSIARPPGMEQETMSEDGTTADESKDFKCPNFVVATRTAVIIHVESTAFSSYDPEKLRGKVIVQGQSGPVQSLACHPEKPYLAISGFSGYIHIWNYLTRNLITFIRMNGLYVSAMQFDSKGDYMAVGCTNGVVKVFEASSFKEVQSFRPSKHSVQMIRFAHDSGYFAFSDMDNCIGIFRWGHRDEDVRKPIEWVYVGRYRSHKKPITGIQFGVVPYGDTPRLMSIGEDRRLIEYSLEKSTITEGVKIKAIHKIGQSATPTAFLWVNKNAKQITVQYPNEKSDDECLLFVNDQYKFTAFTVPDTRPTRCLKTSLCPAFGGPLNRLITVPRRPYDDEGDADGKQKNAPTLLAYSTHQKVIGLIYLPLDGNPNRSMALVAHSGIITDCVVSADGKYLFTAGGSDHTVNFWSINSKFLKEEASKIAQLEGGIIDVNNTEPYVKLIEGGRQGDFFSEIKQYFYYAQIRSQGEVTTTERKITSTVPLNQIPSVVKALGYYASDYEVNNLLNEAQMALGYDPNLSIDLGEIMIDFDTFIKLYVNHRPVLPTSVDDIKRAFVTMGAEAASGIIDSNTFFKLLLLRGERLPEPELNQVLTVLMGENFTVSSYEEAYERFSADDFAALLDFVPIGEEEEAPEQQGQLARPE